MKKEHCVSGLKKCFWGHVKDKSMQYFIFLWTKYLQKFKGTHVGDIFFIKLDTFQSDIVSTFPFSVILVLHTYIPLSTYLNPSSFCLGIPVKKKSIRSIEQKKESHNKLEHFWTFLVSFNMLHSTEFMQLSTFR